MAWNYWNEDISLSNKTSKMTYDILVWNNILGITNKYNIKGENWKVHDDDKYFWIDWYIEVNNSEYSFQEKIRRYNFFKYHDFTLEYYSNVETQEEWEYFHLKAIYYIHWFLNETWDMIKELRIIRIDKMFNLLNTNKEYYFSNIKQNNAHSKANFIPIPLKDLDSVGATVILLKNNWDNTFSQFTKF